MLYEFSVTSPKNTPAADPTIVDAGLVAGLVTRVEVQFPSGCAGLVHASIRDALHQVWPTNPDGDFTADSETIAWDEQYEMPKEPYHFQLVVWNEDDTFPHTVTFRIAMITAQDIARGRAAARALDYLDKWFARQTAGRG